jgi:hypothetical protein
MKLATLTGLTAIGCTFFLAHESNAAYLGLGGQLHSAVTINGTLRAVYRLYAVFDDPNDYLNYIAGSNQLGPLTIRTRNQFETGFGSDFVNVAGGTTAPSAELIDKLPNAQWDTFATIGVAVNDGTDQIGLSPGFPSFIQGNQLTGQELAWFTPGTVEQGRAGSAYAVNGTFYNSNLGGGLSPVTGMGVLFAQLTVNAGSGVKGTVAVGVNLADGLAGGFGIPAQTFNIWVAVPAPGALMLLILGAPLMPRRRRR